ncbi:MAG TPA: glycosyltransferase family 2 protein [Candidatus Acidoferrales bacterium]|jgi:glycosyltransferase involved in cell wall biosynthesis|nr:glycosyltransferase family 2 protein [Candidatus Acidoferrales bacterium]
MSQAGDVAENRGLAPVLSVVTPAFNEASNLPLLYRRIGEVLNPTGVSWEWLIVDDHSHDATFEVVRSIAAADPRVRGIRLARNSGSHVALSCGLSQCRGRCAAFLAADMQDPPETMIALLEKWRAGSQVVWAVRAQREGEKASTLLFARFYYWIMRRVVGLQDMPAKGADFFLLDRRVMDAFRQFPESNLSMVALITWMGFRQDRIEYVKQARLHGASGWSFEKRLKLVIDSVTSFTYLPIRLMSYSGFLIALCGFLYAAFLILHAFAGHPAEGWTSLMVVVLVIGGFQMLLLGVLGEYIWRALDEARRRPRYLVEDATAPLWPESRDDE